MSAIVIAAYGPFLSTYIPVELGGVSLFSVILPNLMALMSLFTRRISNKVSVGFLAGNVVLILTIALLRSVFYKEHFLELLLTSWPIWVLLILALLSSQRGYKSNRREKNIFVYLILSLCLLHTINSVLFIQKIIWINNGFDNSGYEILWGRFRGVLGGANIQGVYNAYLFYCLWKFIKMPFHWSLILWLTALVSVVPTLSRGGILVLVFMLFDVFLVASSRQKRYLVIMTIIISVYSRGFITELSLIQRFMTGDVTSGRLDKLMYFFDLLASENIFLILGIPRYLQSIDVELSDNSFVALFASLGTFLFLWIIGIKYIRKYNGIRWRIDAFLLSIMCVLFLNNAYIWIPWLFLIIPSLILIHGNESIIGQPQSGFYRRNSKMD